MKTNLKLPPKLLLLLLVVGSATAFAQSPTARLLTTFTNSTPAVNNYFGDSVAAFGDDRVLVSTRNRNSPSGGAVYLFSTSGTLLTTFNSPTPAAISFGARLAAVGSDRVLISAADYNDPAPNTGRAYLFSTNGTLLTTLTNRNPAQVSAFGISVAALGSDRLIIGGLANYDTPAPYLGAVYVFGTDGQLLNTLTNPTPAVDDNNFAVSIAAVGNDRVLVGAPSITSGNPGVAYLFSTNGTLLTTFTNPVPVAAHYFGLKVAAVGSDRVLISASRASAGAVPAGSAYLFSTNGTLLTTFTNPVPVAYADFGLSLAAVGSSRVLIGATGAYDDQGTVQAGSAYLFSTNGTLLNTITNPTPATYGFGWAVAAVGKGQVIIGAVGDSTGAAQAGAAYLFDLPYPPLSIARNGPGVSVNWITAETGLALQQTAILGTSPVWSNTTNAVSVSGLTNVVQQTIAGGNTNRFFRLRRP